LEYRFKAKQTGQNIGKGASQNAKVIGEAWNALSDAEKLKYKELGDLYSSGTVPFPYKSENNKEETQQETPAQETVNPETQKIVSPSEIEFGA
jgi:curved DNA-binding protein CbpA